MLSDVSLMIEQFIISLGAWAPFLACLLILIESILPVLPLCAFITINFISFGTLWGFIISWIFTCLGCIISYYLVKKGFRKWTEKQLNKTNILEKTMKYVKYLSLPSFSVILAVPFTPAFVMNIAAGLVRMNFKKFFISVLIGKIFMVYFWGYIGVGIIDSFKDPIIILKVIIMILIAYLLSKIVNKSIKGENN